MHALIVLLIMIFFGILTVCENITINCLRGSKCKVDETVHQAYCEPSCDLDNGGCTDNEVCSLQQQQNCASAPCPPIVQCSSEYLMLIDVLSKTTTQAYIYIELTYSSY